MINVVIILLLVIVVLILSIIVFMVIKKSTYLSKKDRELINFTVDMYLDFGHELDIIDEENHELISKKLNELKDKLND